MAARQVFESDGFMNAKISEITRRAGVAHGTFYVHFPSKEAIFLEVVTTIIQEVFEASGSSAKAGDDPFETIVASIHNYQKIYAQNVGVLKALEQVALVDRQFAEVRRQQRELFVGRVARGIVRLQSAGKADQTIDPRLTAAALISMVHDFTHRQTDMANEGGRKEAVLALARIWARAIRLVSADGEGGR